MVTKSMSSYQDCFAMYEVSLEIYFSSDEDETDCFGQKQLYLKSNTEWFTMPSWYIADNLYLDRGGSRHFWEEVCKYLFFWL